MGIQPDVVTFNAVLHSTRHAAQWRCALETLQRFEAAGYAPDIISISSVLGALNRAREKEAKNREDAARLDQKIDMVFENCLRQRPPVLFGPPCLDTMYEIDLTSLPIAVARAAIRWAMKRILHEEGILCRPVALPVDDGEWYAGDTSGVQDLVFIVGVGVAHTSRDARRKAIARLDESDDPWTAKHVSLREYVLTVLRDEFGLPAEVPGQYPGTIVVLERDLKTWINQQPRDDA